MEQRQPAAALAPKLEQLILDPTYNASIRLTAIHILGQLGLTRSIEPLMQLTQHQDPFTLAAYRALGHPKSWLFSNNNLMR